MTRIAPRPTSRGALPAGPISYEAFLKWEGDNPHVEWVDGEIVPMAWITDDHNLITNFFGHAFQFFIEAHDAGEIRADPFQTKTGPKLPGRAPDLLFVAKRNVSRLKRLYPDGPADLVIEVVSPGSRGVDRGDKFFDYEQGGVPEYWPFDPDRKQHELYHLGANGIYRLAAIPDDGVYRSPAIPGLWVKPAWLWQRPLPTVCSVTKEWGIV